MMDVKMNNLEELALPGARPVRAASLADQAYATLKKWILSGQLDADTVMSENDLSRRLSISRSPLREAIRKLQDEGLLAASGPRGFGIPPISLDLIDQVYGVRLALETEAASHAQSIPPADLARMRAVMEEIRPDVMAGHPQRFTEIDFDFHDLFVRNCGNPLLISYIERLRGNIQRILVYSGELEDHSKHSFDEHMAILEAMEDQDPQRIEATVRKHITGVRDRLREAIVTTAD
jgi:GntR family transcriptional regulator, rspAB operon transcriptional repressor